MKGVVISHHVLAQYMTRRVVSLYLSIFEVKIPDVDVGLVSVFALQIIGATGYVELKYIPLYLARCVWTQQSGVQKYRKECENH